MRLVVPLSVGALTACGPPLTAQERYALEPEPETIRMTSSDLHGRVRDVLGSDGLKLVREGHEEGVFEGRVVVPSLRLPDQPSDHAGFRKLTLRVELRGGKALLTPLPEDCRSPTDDGCVPSALLT